MVQIPLFGPSLWTVTQLTQHLRDLIENDEFLQDVWIQGEISNLSKPASGHLYFTLKDNSSSLKCVMWRNTVLRQTHTPQNGEAIEAHGSINVYEIAGQYQLYTDLIRPAGLGALYQEFLRLKARLENEGLFDEARKRPIPRWPHTIGIVTSPTGAAIRDILKTIQRRYPLVNVIMAPTQVQGDGAPEGILRALATLNYSVHPDVIIVARGGGSIEDLWAFNDERVVRAIANSEAPVVTGIGHETDFTIADFVSDLRAPTPTAAAEMVTPNRVDLKGELDQLHDRIGRALLSIIFTNRWGLNRLESRIKLHSPQSRIRSDRQRVDDSIHRMSTNLNHKIQIQKVTLSGYKLRLGALNPQSILERGYALVRLPTGEIIHSATQTGVGNLLNIQVSDGQIDARVESTHHAAGMPDGT